MKRMKPIAVLLAAALTIPTLSACGTAGPGADASEAGNTGSDLKLTWYFPDSETDHSKKVFETINSYVKDKIGATIEFHPIAWGEYTDKATTILTSGQQFDIMVANDSYFSSVSTGAAAPIETYLKTAGKETWELLPETLWKAVTVDGHIYGIPSYKDNAVLPCLLYNKELAAELGLTIPETYGGLGELDSLFREAKEKRDKKYPADAKVPIISEIYYVNDATENFVDQLACANIPGMECVDGMGSGEQVFNFFDTKTFLDQCKLIRKWVEDGIYPMDAANFDPESTLQNTGKVLFRSSVGYVSYPEHGWSDEVTTGFIPSSLRFMSTDYVASAVNIVGAQSKDPEKAVAFLNLVNTDNTVATTIRFGVEGDYYKRTADNRLDFTGTLNEDPANRAYYKWYGWQYGCLFSASLPIQQDENLWKDLMEANKKAYVADNLGFVYDRTSLSTEIAACMAVRDEFYKNLLNGMIADVEANVAQMNKKLKDAGVEKVVSDVQKQLNEWRAENGKSVLQ